MGPPGRIITDIMEGDIPENSRFMLGKLDGQEFPVMTPPGGSA